MNGEPRSNGKGSSMIKKIIHVNQHKIRSNGTTGRREPVLSCKTYKSNDYCHEIAISVPGVGCVAKVIYSPDKPLPCGAKVWLETNQDIECILWKGDRCKRRDRRGKIIDEA